MTDFIDPFAENLTDAERELLEAKVTSGVDPAPAAPVSPSPKGKRVPGTFRNRMEGLQKLRPDEIPVPGQHFVVWGSKLLDDIIPRPVRLTASVTENQHALEAGAHAQALVDGGLKDPHGGTKYPRTRKERAEAYARWRYKGFLAGEVSGL